MTKRQTDRLMDEWMEKVTYRKTKIKRGETVLKNKEDLKPPRGETYKKKYADGFKDDKRRAMFQNFWELVDTDLQKALLISHITVGEKQKIRICNTCKTARRERERPHCQILHFRGVKHLTYCTSLIS